MINWAIQLCYILAEFNWLCSIKAVVVVAGHQEIETGKKNMRAMSIHNG